MTTSGAFDFTQLNSLRDAHLDWCAANSVDPKSELGGEAATYLLQAFNAGSRSADQMIAALDQFIEERANRVQLGSSVIPSTSDRLPG
ncbi:hypothetical protein [Rhizobium wenxiniae]|uniref:hypothetical protein n=1 Tax=Rhizobium wenxiniae TaxID=1737357 RepID=UPI003C1E8C43